MPGDYQTIEVRPLSSALGAEIRGVDVGAGPDGEQFAEIRRAYHEFGVVFFRDQQLSPEHTCRFCRRQGSIAFWDNRAAWHRALNDYHGQRRLMHRITLEGVPLN